MRIIRRSIERKQGLGQRKKDGMITPMFRAIAETDGAGNVKLYSRLSKTPGWKLVSTFRLKPKPTSSLCSGLLALFVSFFSG
jgi:hypothetical protein